MIAARPLYVCFRPNQDAFVIVHFYDPSPREWESDKHGESQSSRVIVREFRDGVLYDIKGIVGDWTRYRSEDEPVFEGERDGPFKDVTIDQEQIHLEYPLKNLNGGTTRYSLTIRRSTGRFTERFDAEENTSLSSASAGTCLIYR